MAYVRIGEEKSTLGSFACGPGCSCAGCRQTAAGVNGLGERYVPEEEEAPPPPPAQPPPQRPAPALPPRSNLSGWGRFGEPLLQRRLSPTGGLQLCMPAFATLTGFARGRAGLNAAQLERVKRAAEFIAQSWSGTSPIKSIRITGYIDANEQPDLGQRRAAAVRDALFRAIDSTRPGLATRLRWILEDRGFSSVAKVEIYLWHGPTPPPVPPLVRIPSPAETARRAEPMRPETTEERIQRTVTTPPPKPPPRRSFSQMFWNKIDENLNSTMNRFGVPQSLRGRIRDAAHAALEKGAEGLLNQALDETGLSKDVKEAIQASVRAAAKTPVGRDTGSPPLEAWDLGQPSPGAPVFRFECASGCAPLPADQCRKVLLQAIRDAIHLASNSASKLEANPRDAKTVGTFLKLFGHDPSRQVPWAENKESGAIVAWRLRKVAQELGGGRRTFYRCGCPGAAPTVNARTVSPLEVRLCSRFWSLGQPGFLPVGQNPRWIRAGIILHEMLHQLFREFFRHFRVPPRPDDPQERRRDNSHCYEAFALLVNGHTPSQSDINRCTKRPA